MRNQEKELPKRTEHRFDGDEKSSQSNDLNSLYPDGVDPSLSDEEHNSRGKWSPYSEKQRMAAAVLIRRYQNEDGMSLEDAQAKAFHAVGEPDFIDQVTNGKDKDDFVPKTQH